MFTKPTLCQGLWPLSMCHQGGPWARGCSEPQGARLGGTGPCPPGLRNGWAWPGLESVLGDTDCDSHDNEMERRWRAGRPSRGHLLHPMIQGSPQMVVAALPVKNFVSVPMCLFLLTSAPTPHPQVGRILQSLLGALHGAGDIAGTLGRVAWVRAVSCSTSKSLPWLSGSASLARALQRQTDSYLELLPLEMPDTWLAHGWG